MTTFRCPTDIETLSLGNILQMYRVRSFYITDCTNWMNIFYTVFWLFQNNTDQHWSAIAKDIISYRVSTYRLLLRHILVIVGCWSPKDHTYNNLHKYPKILSNSGPGWETYSAICHVKTASYGNTATELQLQSKTHHTSTRWIHNREKVRNKNIRETNIHIIQILIFFNKFSLPRHNLNTHFMMNISLGLSVIRTRRVVLKFSFFANNWHTVR